MNKIKYIIMTLALVLSTAAVILVPEFVKVRQNAIQNETTVYYDSNIVEHNPLTSLEVAEIISKGKLIYAYSDMEPSVSEDSQLKNKSVEVLNDLFSDDAFLCNEITDRVSDSDILYSERKNCFAVVDDRLVVLDVISVNFSSQIGVTFEEKTSAVLDFYWNYEFWNEAEANEMVKMFELCAEKYYSFLEKSSANYITIAEFYENNAYFNINIESGYESGEKEILN